MNMLRLTLVAICVALIMCPAATSLVRDDNAIIEVAFKNEAMNMSGNCSLSLTPGSYIVAVYRYADWVQTSYCTRVRSQRICDTAGARIQSKCRPYCTRGYLFNDRSLCVS